MEKISCVYLALFEFHPFHPYVQHVELHVNLVLMKIWNIHCDDKTYWLDVVQCHILDIFRWIVLNPFQCMSQHLQSFRYRPDGEFDLARCVCAFRGRLIDLQKNLSKLHQLGWIDNRTHTVKIQLNLYNPNRQLFTEVLLSSGMQTQMDFQLIGSILYLELILCVCFWRFSGTVFVMLEIRNMGCPNA